MQKFKKRLKRGFAFFVVLTMCISVLQMSAFAEEQMQPGGDQSAVKQADSQESNAAESGMPESAVGGSANDASAAALGFNAGENETLTNDENSTFDSAGETSAGETSPAEDGIEAQVDKLSENAQKFIDQVTALGKISADDKKVKQEAIEEAETLYAALTDEEKALPEVAQAYQALLGEKQALSTVFYVGDAPGEDAVYDEDSPVGSAEHPYSSLADAVDAADKQAENDHAKKSFTFILTSNLTATKCARINGTDITIDGKGHTITRCDGFNAIQDNARSTYNPAMIEVCNSGFSKTASLRLENITLNDGGRTAGTRYSQASTNGGGNGDTVQDAIIATYDGVGTIVLGSGTTLTGYGGMSSVRLSGGTLIMESGSTITGGKSCTNKGGGNGPAGAVWIQGGSFTMNAGASINGVMGRAIYIDGGSATVNGTISNIKGNLNMWQGESGVAIHVRNEGYAVLGKHGVIENITGDHAGYRGAVTTNFSRGEGLYDFEAKQGSVIRNVTGFPTLYSNYGTELLNGQITECNNDFIIGGFAQNTTIGKTGVIEKCTASKGAANAIVYTSNASKVFLKGSVQDNTASYGFYIINQSGGGALLEMYDGALIAGNSGTGVYINASECRFTMHGGVIEKNKSYGVYAREKNNRAATFIMEDGIIRNNGSYGVYYSTNSGKTGRVDITGGEISGNGSRYSPYQISISGANSEDNLSRAYIKPGIVKEANDKKDVINTSFAQVTNINVGEGNEDFYIGNAKAAASNKIKEQSKAYKDAEGDIYDYEAKGSALWFKTPDRELSFDASRSTSINKDLPLYIAYLPVKADGTPKDDATVVFKKVNNDDVVNIELEGLEKDQSYALMWMQPTEKFGYIELIGTPEISEKLGESEYDIEYTTTYTLLKDIAGSVKPGDELKLTVKLDDRLTYDETSEDAKATLADSEAFVLDRTEYNDIDKTLTFILKIKEGFSPKYSFSKYPAVISFKIKATVNDFEAEDISTNASISGDVLLTGHTSKTHFTFETLKPAKTDLTPLPTYKITYTGGELDKVKEGTELLLSLGDGGTIEGDLPSEVTSDITLPDPVREGYLFDYWSYTRGKTAVTFVANWRTPDQPPTPVDPVNPPTPPNPPTPAPTPAPATAPAAAPAVAPVAPIAAPLAQVAPAAVPLANQDAEDTREVADEQTPLAKGAENDWALLNLILMIGTVLASGLMLIFFFLGRKEAAYENSSELEAGWNDEAGGFLNRKTLFRFLSLIPAIASIIFFVLTEDMASPMVIVDKWTPWMVVFALVNVVFAILSKKKRYGSGDTQKPGYGMA